MKWSWECWFGYNTFKSIISIQNPTTDLRLFTAAVLLSPQNRLNPIRKQRLRIPKMEPLSIFRHRGDISLRITPEMLQLELDLWLFDTRLRARVYAWSRQSCDLKPMASCKGEFIWTEAVVNVAWIMVLVWWFCDVLVQHDKGAE